MSGLLPRAVWERAHEFVRAYDLESFADLFAIDGVMELPFAPPTAPHRLEGREAIRRFLAAAGASARQSGRRIISYSNVRIHETLVPEVIVVEFDLNGATADGRTYQYAYIQVMRVRAGEIVYMRDYTDPRVFTEHG